VGIYKIIDKNFGVSVMIHDTLDSLVLKYRNIHAYW
jgi:hypothetical protein